MSKVLLSHWESVELFCRIICKAENLDISIFDDDKKFLSYLALSEKDTFCNRITKSIYKGAKTNAGQDKGGKVFFNLSRSVRWREPFMPSLTTINDLKDFVGDSSYTIQMAALETWKPLQKKMQYSDTNWSIYTYDEEMVEEDITTKKSVINRGFLTFKRFSKVEIDNLNIKSGELEKYIGEFHIYGNKDYLVLKMQTHDYQKYLRMEFYIGATGLVSIALGQYHNIDNAIYSGTAILIREPKERQIDVRTYDLNKEEDKTEIPDYVCQYFKIKRLNVLRTPAKINTVKELKAWMKQKNAQ